MLLASRALQALKGWSRCRGRAVEAETTQGRMWCCCTGSRHPRWAQVNGGMTWRNASDFKQNHDHTKSELFSWNIVQFLCDLGYFLTSFLTSSDSHQTFCLWQKHLLVN